MQLDFNDVKLINAYFPSGTSGDIRQTFKYKWLDEFFTWLHDLKKKHQGLFYVVIIILHIKKLTFMTQRGIKIHRVFYQKKENGWINFSKVAGPTHFVSCTLSLIDIAGGVSDFPLCDYKIKAGELIILMLQIR